MSVDEEKARRFGRRTETTHEDRTVTANDDRQSPISEERSHHLTSPADHRGERERSDHLTRWIPVVIDKVDIDVARIVDHRASGSQRVEESGPA
jgi:hypothetical protein